MRAEPWVVLLLFAAAILSPHTLGGTPGAQGQGTTVGVAARIQVGPGSVASLDWSPDGGMLAVLSLHRNTDNWSLAVYNSSWDRVWTDTGPGVDAWSAAWSPDGGMLAVGASQELIVYNRGGDRLFRILMPTPITSISWLKDLLVVGTLDAVYMVSPGQGILWDHKLGLGGGLHVAGGPIVAVAAPGPGESRLYAFDPNGGSLWNTTLRGEVIDLEWSPGGEYLGVASWWSDGDRSYWGLHLLTPTGATARSIAMEGIVTSISWSPDGSLVAAGLASGEIVILALSGEVAWSSVAFGSMIVGDLAWSRGWMLAVGENYPSRGETSVTIYTITPGASDTTVTVTVTETTTMTLTTTQPTTVTSTVTVTATTTVTTGATATETLEETVTVTETLTTSTISTVTETLTATLPPYTTTVTQTTAYTTTQTLTTTLESTVTVTSTVEAQGLDPAAVALSLAILAAGAIASTMLKRS